MNRVIVNGFSPEDAPDGPMLTEVDVVTTISLLEAGQSRKSYFLVPPGPDILRFQTYTCAAFFYTRTCQL